ncbi:MAG TPA: zf-HC2 domain-containing protein [Thermoanaerobaculia bacterium]
MNHFTDIELHRWRDSGPGADRERVVAHLAECADCASRYAAVIRTMPLRAEPAVEAQEFVAAGRRIASRRRWVAPLAAAAVLAIAVAIPLMVHRSEPTLHFRGSGVQALAPQGAIDQSEVEFVWSSGISATRYRLEVADAKGVINTKDAAESPIRISLGPGEYWWTVTALDSNGKPLTSSQRLTFTIRPR